MIKWYCPFCKSELEETQKNHYWCKNCVRLWKLEIIEQYIR